MATTMKGKFMVLGLEAKTAKASGNKFWALALMPGADAVEGPGEATVPPWGAWMIERLTQAAEAGEEIGLELQEWTDRDGAVQRNQDGSPKWNITGVEGLAAPARSSGGGGSAAPRASGMSRDEAIRARALDAAIAFSNGPKANKANTVGATALLFDGWIRAGGDLPC